MNRHEYFMAEAIAEARLALASGDFPVGCVLVADDAIVGRGRRKNSGEGARNELDHAEVDTLRRLIKSSPGFDCTRLTVYSTMEPCLMCFSTMLLSGIRTYVWAYEDIMGGGTSLPLHQLNPLYVQMDVELVPGVLRQSSLKLFQDFFRKYSYWEESMLSEYTLAQPLGGSAG